uniref:Uncharacterized protein n=1 Tax=Arundo donax TaxID=35708 RepID=A0A0A9DMM5_ARUDO
MMAVSSCRCMLPRISCTSVAISSTEPILESSSTFKLKVYKTMSSTVVMFRCSGGMRSWCSPATSFSSCFGRRRASTLRHAWPSTIVTSMSAIAAGRLLSAEPAVSVLTFDASLELATLAPAPQQP